MSCIYVYIANVHVGVPVCMCCINGGLDGHGCAKCGEGGVGVGVMCTGFIYFPFLVFLFKPPSSACLGELVAATWEGFEGRMLAQFSSASPNSLFNLNSHCGSLSTTSVSSSPCTSP